MNARQLAKERHKRWGTASVWCTQWWSDSVAYCKSPEGKQKFEEWVRIQFGQNADDKLEECYAGPHRSTLPADSDFAKFHKAAVELGISDEFMVQAHMFCASRDLCAPERTLPPPSRKRGESSAEWLARRNDELLKGCKLPPINWPELRRIATSQFDLVRDQLEVWRTQPDMFFHDILERAASTIVSPGVLPENLHFQSCMDAMRSRLHITHLQYAAWSKAVAFFKECDRKGFSGPTAVMRACKEDHELMGRLVAMVCYGSELGRWMFGKLPQVITSGDFMRPFFIRDRDEHGTSHIRPNFEYARTHRPKHGTIEDTFLYHYRDGVVPMKPAALMGKLTALLRDPAEARKVTAEAFDTVGDLAIVNEFLEEIRQSTFGFALREAVHDAHRTGASKSWYPYLSPIAEKKLRRVPYEPEFELFGESDNIVKSVVDTWLSVVFNLDIAYGLQLLMRTRDFIPMYDEMWAYVDGWFWNGANDLERAPGAMKEFFGLYSPEDQRPMFMVEFLGRLRQEEEEERLAQEAAAAPPPEPYVSSIPMATPQDSVAKAPSRAPGEKKIKAKKRKAGAEQLVQIHSNETVPDEVRDDRNLPDVLAKDWKLSRRNLDIFHRLLGTEEKSGQIRWGDFEKAMKQIGFDVVQTEGSSVRFDPPAKKARSITFHRPHPDSTLTPHIVKWVGARLKRCYGWTIDTFSEDPTQEA